MTFINMLNNHLKNQKQYTDNGAVGYATSGRELLDMNYAVGSMRQWTDEQILKQYVKAYYENPLLSVKWLFYLRDIRGVGMGERRIFRVCLKWLISNQFDYTYRIIDLVPEYGRYDDLMCLLDTKAKGIVISIIREQLMKDIDGMQNGKPISLLAKWLPSCNTSSANTRQKAKIVYEALDIREKDYRKILSRLRAYLNVVEVKMADNAWSDIDYSKLPSRANLIYGNAFLRNDEDRRREFLGKLTRGEVKINADTLFPSDIVAKYYKENNSFYRYGKDELKERDDTLEGLWNSLPDYVNGDGSTLVVRDGSGSMTVKIGNTNISALNVATALSIYFAEHCKGEYHNKFITFSSTPQIVDMSNARCLRDKLEICDAYQDITNTNIQAVFELILQTAVYNRLPQSKIPKNVLIVSDMEFDSAIGTYIWDDDRTSGKKCTLKTLFELISDEYQKYGYKMPRLIFWNVCSRTQTIPLKENDAGVTLVSGFNPAVYNMVLSDELDPYKCLIKQINSKRYDAVERRVVGEKVRYY